MVTPVALGPGQVPAVTDLGTARRVPELAVLSALAHGGRPEPAPVFEALVTALDIIDHDHANLYTDLVFAVLPAAARDCLEELMNIAEYQYQSEFARRYFSQGKAQGEAQGKAQGEARGEAKAVLAILDARASPFRTTSAPGSPPAQSSISWTPGSAELPSLTRSKTWTTRSPVDQIAP
jgi:hypothetical protein